MPRDHSEASIQHWTSVLTFTIGLPRADINQSKTSKKSETKEPQKSTDSMYEKAHDLSFKCSEDTALMLPNNP